MARISDSFCAFTSSEAPTDAVLVQIVVHYNSFDRLVKELIALILCTPVVRRRFNDKGEFYDVHGEYPDLTRSVAKETSTELVDMHKLSEAIVREHGAEGSVKMFVHLKPGDLACVPEGKIDDTHFNEYGANLIANQFVKNSIEQKLSISKFLK